MKTEKKLAAITGASSGIGLELAKVFAKNNYDLVICSDSDKILVAASDLRNLGCEVTTVIADLSTREGADKFYQEVKASGRTLDVAALNAGVGLTGPFVETDIEQELKIMHLNAVYTVYLAKLFLTDMNARNEGKILFTSSIAGEMPGSYYSVYAGTKAFIQSFAEALHFEMKDMDRNITITALQPGPTDTNFFARADMEDTKVGEMEKDDPAKVAQDGFDALMAGKDHVVSGLKNKIKVGVGKFMTEQMGARTQANEAKPNDMKQ
jgi:short-subunit dehydrogenase